MIYAPVVAALAVVLVLAGIVAWRSRRAGAEARKRASGTAEMPGNVEVEEVIIDTKLPADVLKEIVRSAREAAWNGLRAGVAVILVGVALLLLGVSGAVDISFVGGGANGHVATSAVGVVIALIGLGIIYWTRYNVVTNPSSANAGKAGGK